MSNVTDCDCGQTDLQVEQSFFSFFASFLPFQMIFQSSACQKCCRTLKNHGKWQKYDKLGRRKSLVQHTFNLFLAMISGHKNPISETLSITTLQSVIFSDLTLVGIFYSSTFFPRLTNYQTGIYYINWHVCVIQKGITLL